MSEKKTGLNLKIDSFLLCWAYSIWDMTLTETWIMLMFHVQCFIFDLFLFCLVSRYCFGSFFFQTSGKLNVRWCFCQQFMRLFLFGLVCGPREVHTWIELDQSSVESALRPPFWRGLGLWGPFEPQPKCERTLKSPKITDRSPKPPKTSLNLKSSSKWFKASAVKPVQTHYNPGTECSFCFLFCCL